MQIELEFADSIVRLKWHYKELLRISALHLQLLEKYAYDDGGTQEHRNLQNRRHHIIDLIEKESAILQEMEKSWEEARLSCKQASRKMKYAGYYEVKTEIRDIIFLIQANDRKSRKLLRKSPQLMDEKHMNSSKIGINEIIKVTPGLMLR